MERNVDFDTAKQDNFRTDENIVSFMGSQLPKKDQYYYDTNYNSQYIMPNQTAYDAAKAQGNKGLTPQQQTDRNNAAGAQIAQAGAIALGGYILAPLIAGVGAEAIAFARNPMAYCAINPVNCVAAVDTAAGTAAGVPNTGTPIPHTVPGKGTADKLLPDADFAGRIPVRSDLIAHLTDAKVSGRQISGGHNESNFMAALNDAKGAVDGKTEIAPGVTEVQYKLPGKEYPNGFPTKTVYDPKVYSDTKIADMAQEAASKGMLKYMQGGYRPGDVLDIPVNGINFQVPIKDLNKTPGGSASLYVPSVYPGKKGG